MPELPERKPNSNAAQSEKTPFQKFHAMAQALVRVPKSEVDQKLADLKAAKKRIKK
jgi:hypothetical protein